MNYTFRNNIWKGDATNSIIPTNSRPFTNDDVNLQSVARTQGKANPLKHWRKQLQPYYHTKSSKQVSIDMLNAPNSIVYYGERDHDCSLNNTQLLKENITLLTQCLGTKYVYNDQNNKVRCIGGSHNIKRSGSTNLSKGYYSSYNKYLQAKCKTYDQNFLLGEKTDTDYEYNSSKCSDTSMKCNKPVIYKPSNRIFSTQGSVSASSNILRKKNLAITNNSASLKTAYGNSYVKIGPYYEGSTGYEIRYLKGNNEPNLCEQTFKTCK